MCARARNRAALDTHRPHGQSRGRAGDALDQFIAETMSVLATDADEILVHRAKAFRANASDEQAIDEETMARLGAG